MDTLTGIAGRADFFNALDIEIREHEQKDSTLAVVLLNIKGFRTINSVYGYSAADQILQQVAERIQSVKRQQDIAGRVGIDEFALVLLNLKSPHLAGLAANKLIASLEEIFLDDGSPVDIKIHIGIAVFPEHGTTSDALMQQADVALHTARDTWQAYQIANNSQLTEASSSELVHDLEHAISNSELELHYQPKVDLHELRLLGAEALMRWESPEHGLVSPDTFIPLAEDNGLIFPLTLWSLNTALRQGVEIRRLWPDFRMAVNLSASTLTEYELIELVMRALRTWGTAPDKLMIEVTESAIMKNPEASIKTLQGLRELGVKLSIDDFGTGYSSFSYLKQLPVHELKIDQSFVMGMATDVNDTRIVQTMINLGQNFELSVIAEGIEDEETLYQLASMGCHHGQGYYISRPLTRERFLQWVQDSEWTRTPLPEPSS
ncbi:MAG: bifunctional diguanylate cyclase/phosphodiesterase [Gammaproteobacteria bacterium]|nr:bifunctional diguanylate cyclase/phosphodiesterase [Gammaproteobacteria bacterium]MDH3560927.1 bifunctional diguanylate cyclase/phosphodiesterase [Gammaproteobacteria bacterium]